MPYSDFRSNKAIAAAVKRLVDSKIPFVVVHLPMGSSLAAGKEFEFRTGDGKLLLSLEALLGEQVVRLQPYIPVDPQQALRMCAQPSDCHPSPLGMELYADAVSRVIIERLSVGTE